MKYVSTRGNAPRLDFADVLLTGLARDGGLYVPEEWPQLTPRQIAGFAGKPYGEVAFEILKPFVGECIQAADLRRMIDQAYGTFRHPAITPLVQTGSNEFILELFHGPTLAFKDVAMQLLGLLMDHVLEERDQRATIVGATSGDTGGAAIDAFKGRDRTDMFIMFPNGRVSPVQQRQMTTITDENVHALALEGTFDDCQSIVKGMFNHFAFRDRVMLAGVNSINWARIMAQVVYYFVAAVALGAPHRKVAFTVPTGNFGDIFAGYVAARMGLSIDRLTVATNVNDILARALKTGRYDIQGVVPTMAPSMDIQVSSNFERLLFEVSNRDGAAVKAMMDGLVQSGGFDIPEPALEEIRVLFGAGRADEETCSDTISHVLRDAGYLLDPHTAVAVAVARQHKPPDDVPMVVLATAHPAKFPSAVEEACGVKPALPAWQGDLMDRPEKFEILSASQAAVEEFILTNARAAGVEA
ncbi:MAG: threonine synthase [Stappiaceae bacterium]